jgi:hypothetical protein
VALRQADGHRLIVAYLNSIRLARCMSFIPSVREPLESFVSMRYASSNSDRNNGHNLGSPNEACRHRTSRLNKRRYLGNFIGTR